MALGTQTFLLRSQHLWTLAFYLFRFKHQILNNCIQMIDLFLKIWKINCDVLALSCNHLLQMVVNLFIAIVNWLNNEVLNLCHNRLHHTGFDLTQENLLVNLIMHSYLEIISLQILQLSFHFFNFANDPRKRQILTVGFFLRHHNDVFYNFKLLVQVSVRKLTDLKPLVNQLHLVSHFFHFHKSGTCLFCVSVNQIQIWLVPCLV